MDLTRVTKELEYDFDIAELIAEIERYRTSASRARGQHAAAIKRIQNLEEALKATETELEEQCEAAEQKLKEQREEAEKKLKEQREEAEKKLKEQREAAEQKLKEQREAAEQKLKEQREAAEEKLKEQLEATRGTAREQDARQAEQDARQAEQDTRQAEQDARQAELTRHLEMQESQMLCALAIPVTDLNSDGERTFISDTSGKASPATPMLKASTPSDNRSSKCVTCDLIPIDAHTFGIEAQELDSYPGNPTHDPELQDLNEHHGGQHPALGAKEHGLKRPQIGLQMDWDEQDALCGDTTIGEVNAAVWGLDEIWGLFDKDVVDMDYTYDGVDFAPGVAAY